MNKTLRNIGLLILPYLIVLIVNEGVKYNTKKSFENRIGINTINSDKVLMNKCTWACFYNTTHCLKAHTKTFRPIVPYLNILYFGIISGLHSTGNYVAANLFFLVTLWPLLIYILLLKVLNNHEKLKLKK